MLKEDGSPEKKCKNIRISLALVNGFNPFIQKIIFSYKIKKYNYSTFLIKWKQNEEKAEMVASLSEETRTLKAVEWRPHTQK